MSEQTRNPFEETQAPLPAVKQESRPIPAAVWSRLQAEARELKAQKFESREQLLDWLQARGYEDGEKILQRLQDGGEI